MIDPGICSGTTGSTGPPGPTGPPGSTIAPATVAVPTIGTPASPGALRAITGNAATPSIDAGGFWVPGDNGGGTFYWDSTYIGPDDVMVHVIPTGHVGAGAWVRIYSGPFNVMWSGVHGDGIQDDTAAINLAMALSASIGQTLEFDPSKVYRIDGVLTCDNSQGLTLDGLAGVRLTLGSRLIYHGARTGAIFSAKSVLGLRMIGLIHDYTHVTLVAPDFTYATAAARLASVHPPGDVGKIALQTDTGQRFYLTAAPSTWAGESLNGIDTGHSLSGVDSSGVVIESCSFGDNVSGAVTRAVRLIATNSTCISNCIFSNCHIGISGLDFNFGGGLSANIATIDKCVFEGSGSGTGRGIVNPYESWNIINCGFEPRQDGTLDGITFDTSQGHALGLRNNWHGDATGGKAMELFGVLGVSIDACLVTAGGAGAIAVDITGCAGLKSGGNEFVLQTAYNINAGATSSGLLIGPDSFTGVVYRAGTNYINSWEFDFDTSSLNGGLSVGDQNTLSGQDCFAVGRLNSAGGFGMVCGVSNVGSVGGLTTGQNAVSRNNSEETMGGGSIFGGGGSTQSGRTMCTNNCPAGVTTALLNTAQLSPCMTLANSRLYTIEALFTIYNRTSTKRFSAFMRCQVERSSVGVVTVLSTTVGTIDPDGTGISVAAVPNGSDLDFQVTNPLGVAVRANARVFWGEISS